ncbi:MAG: MBL fold metallo-hydrolase [Deltaproteobacteria bacterium]|nr:MBL fold metallo-hydrolase [Deltaproteobacteria bacterium]
MKFRIITLSEDRVSGPDLIGQLGLSILIEANEGNILFDTGQGISASHNADVIGFDLTTIDRIVLSHGHFDHTGGLREILLRIHREEIEITGHPDIWESKYVRSPEDGMDRYVGIPFRRDELERLGARFNLTRQPVKLTDNIITTGEVPMTTDFEGLSPKMVVKEGSEWRPDELMDDQAIIITTWYGLIVILGCAHRGVINKAPIAALGYTPLLRP